MLILAQFWIYRKIPTYLTSSFSYYYITPHRQRRKKNLFGGVGERSVLSCHLPSKSPASQDPGGRPAYGIFFNDIHWFQPSQFPISFPITKVCFPRASPRGYHQSAKAYPEQVNVKFWGNTSKRAAHPWHLSRVGPCLLPRRQGPSSWSLELSWAHLDQFHSGYPLPQSWGFIATRCQYW